MKTAEKDTVIKGYRTKDIGSGVRGKYGGEQGDIPILLIFFKTNKL